MCTLYTLRLSAWEVRNLMQHYKLVGREWEEVNRRAQRRPGILPKLRGSGGGRP